MDVSIIDRWVSGIYLITNVASSKIYVGSARSIKYRWSGHKTYLKKGIHHNLDMQRDWDMYGEESFNCTVLEVVGTENELMHTEQKWIDKLNVCNPDIGYNILPFAYRQTRPAKNCTNCGRPYKGLRHGRCQSCAEYLRRRGIERPYKVDGRIEKSQKVMDLACEKCKRPATIKGNPVKGFCRSCYRVNQAVRARANRRGQ